MRISAEGPERLATLSRFAGLLFFTHLWEAKHYDSLRWSEETQAKLKSKGANNLWPFLPVWIKSSCCTQCKRKQGTGPALVWWKKTLNYDKGWHHFASTLCAADVSFTQVVLETVACLVGVGEAGIKRSRPVVLDLLLDSVWHFSAAGGLHRINSMWATLKWNHVAHTDYKKAFISTKYPNNSQSELLK